MTQASWVRASTSFLLLPGLEVPVLVRREPERAGPDADRAERQRGHEVPARRHAPGGEDRRVGRARQLGDLGDDREGADAAGVPAGVLALRDDQVEPGIELAGGLAGEADEAPDLHARVVQLVEDERRAAHPRGEDRDLLAHEQLQLGARVGHAAQPRCAPRPRRLRLWELVGAHQAVDELAMLLGELLIELLAVALDVGRRQRDVAAERAVADALLDPGEVGPQRVHAVGAAAEHADRAGVGGGGDHVAGVREGDDRVLAAVLVAEPRLQGIRGHGCHRLAVGLRR